MYSAARASLPSSLQMCADCCPFTPLLISKMCRYPRTAADSPNVYLHCILGRSKASFAPTALLSISPHIGNAFMPAQFSTIPTSFSTAFSGDSSKLAVASQEGVVVVWDAWSMKPLRVFHMDKSRVSRSRSSMSYY